MLIDWIIQNLGAVLFYAIPTVFFIMWAGEYYK